MPNVGVAIPLHRAALVVLTTQLGLIMVVCSALTGKRSDLGRWKLPAHRHPSTSAYGASVEVLQPAGDPKVAGARDREPNPALRPHSPDDFVAQLNRLAGVVVTRIGSLYGP